MKQETRGYVVADGRRAKLLLRHGQGRYETLVELEREPDVRPRSDSRVRVFQSFGRGRSAVGDAPPGHNRLADAFMGTIEETISKAVERAHFARFVLVAPPRVLGALRSRFPAELQGRVVCELAKDLTKLPEAELHERLNRLSLHEG